MKCQQAQLWEGRMEWRGDGVTARRERGRKKEKRERKVDVEWESLHKPGLPGAGEQRTVPVRSLRGLVPSSSHKHSTKQGGKGNDPTVGSLRQHNKMAGILPLPTPPVKKIKQQKEKFSIMQS